MLHLRKTLEVTDIKGVENWLLLLVLGIFSILFAFKTCFIYFFAIPLEKVLAFALGFITALYGGLNLKFFSKSIARDIVTGFIIFLLMLISTMAPFWVVSLVFGSKPRFDLGIFLVVIPFMLTVGLGEEVFFRGVLQEIFVKRYGLRKGVFLASFLFFAIWHIAWVVRMNSIFNFIIFVLYAGFLGVLLGLAYAGYKSLLPVIIAHATWDIVMRSLSIPSTKLAPLKYYLIALIISAIIYIFLLKHFIRLVNSLSKTSKF